MATGFIMLDSPNTRTAQGTYPRRGGFRPSGTCIVHTSEGSWQAGVDSLTRLVQTRADYGCYHQACDWADIARYYPWEWECWQDSETNNWAVGIAAACKTSDWLAMPGEIREGYYRNLARMAADFVTYMRETYGVVVPLRRLSGAEARAGVPGFCAHGDSGVARSDPGRDFDWSRFFDYIRQALGGYIMPQGSIITEEDPLAVLNEEQTKRLNAAVDRTLGRDEQRWLVVDKATGRIVPCPANTPGAWAARSADVGDVLNVLYSTQDGIARLAGGLDGVLEALKQVHSGGGAPLDLEAVKAASEAGAREALASLRVVSIEEEVSNG